MTQRTLPGFKAVEYGKASSLFFETKEAIQEGSSVVVYGNFTGVPIVSLCGCSVSSEIVSGETIYTTVLNFQVKDCKDYTRRLMNEIVMTDCCFRLTDIYNEKYLVGLDKKPHPTIKPSFQSDILPSGVRVFNVEVTYVNTHSLLLLA